MDTMIYTLPGGAVFIALLFWGLTRVSRWPRRFIGVLLALVALVMYLTYAALSWPGMDVVAIHIAVYLMTIYVLAIVFAQLGTQRRRWHWGPAAIIGFFLGVFVLEAALIVLAQEGLDKTVAKVLLPEPRSGASGSSRFPGTVSHDFREKSNQFNEYVAQRKAQRARGWQVKLGWALAAQAGVSNELIVQVQDRHERPLTGARVHGRFLRPSNKALDQAFEMKPDGAGLYTASLTLPEAGHWDLVLSVERAGKTHEVRADTFVAGDAAR